MKCKDAEISMDLRPLKYTSKELYSSQNVLHFVIYWTVSEEMGSPSRNYAIDSDVCATITQQNVDCDIGTKGFYVIRLTEGSKKMDTRMFDNWPDVL